MKKRWLSFLIVLMAMFTFHAFAIEIPNQWQMKTTNVLSIRKIMDDGGKIISTDSLSWPDRGPALIVYLQKDKDVFRCMDYFNKDFQSTGYICYELK